MNPTIRRIQQHEERRFLERIVETSWRDLSAHLQTRYSAEGMTGSVERVVRLLLEQGDNLILVADLPEMPNAGQIWLGQARDPYTGTQRGYIYDLFVEAAARQQGIGKALLQAAENASRARGDAELALTVAAHNHAGQALYDSFGFAVERLIVSKPL